MHPGPEELSQHEKLIPVSEFPKLSNDMPLSRAAKSSITTVNTFKMASLVHHIFVMKVYLKAITAIAQQAPIVVLIRFTNSLLSQGYLS